MYLKAWEFKGQFTVLPTTLKVLENCKCYYLKEPPLLSEEGILLGDPEKSNKTGSKQAEESK